MVQLLVLFVATLGQVISLFALGKTVDRPVIQLFKSKPANSDGVQFLHADLEEIILLDMDSISVLFDLKEISWFLWPQKILFAYIAEAMLLAWVAAVALKDEVFALLAPLISM